MRLLTDKVLATDNSIKLMDLLYKSFINYKQENFQFKKIISYEEFKTIIHKFIIDIMGLFLINTKYSDDTYDVYIKNLSKNLKGYFVNKENFLIINESVIKDIYDGDLESFIVIFHELNHFKIKYYVLCGVVNYDICRIVKEKLLRKESVDPFGELGSIKSLKGKRSHINDFYYDDNYSVFSEEVFATIEAKRDFVLLMSFLLTSYKLNNEESEKACQVLFDELAKKDFARYNNHIRDFSMNLNFNTNYFDFNKAFDFSVKYHPEWLKYPQISIEYYIDEFGKVNKRNVEQLKILLKDTNEIEVKEYIQGLINNLEINIEHKKK